MSIANAAVTAGHDFAAGDTVTDTTLDAAASPTVGLSPTGDTDTGLSSPAANILGVETGGTERGRFTSSGLQVDGLGGTANNDFLAISGGTIGDGATIYVNGSGATDADELKLNADTTEVRSKNGSAVFATFSSSGMEVGPDGDPLTGIWTGTKSMSTGTVAASGSASDTLTVTGAETGSAVLVSPADAMGAFTLYGRVTAANTVTITMYNTGSTGLAYTGDVYVVVFGTT